MGDLAKMDQVFFGYRARAVKPKWYHQLFLWIVPTTEYKHDQAGTIQIKEVFDRVFLIKEVPKI